MSQHHDPYFTASITQEEATVKRAFAIFRHYDTLYIGVLLNALIELSNKYSLEVPRIKFYMNILPNGSTFLPILDNVEVD